MQVSINWDDLGESDDIASKSRKKRTRKKSPAEVGGRKGEGKNKSKSLVDPAYIHNIHYDSSPGKLRIEISYEPNADVDLKQGENVMKINKHIVNQLKTLF